MTETEKLDFIDKITSTSPARLMTRNEHYVIQKCIEVVPELGPAVDTIKSPAQLFSILNTIRSTPEHKVMEAQLGGSYQVKDLFTNICNVCEDVVVGRAPLPTDFGSALVEDFVQNSRAVDYSAIEVSGDSILVDLVKHKKGGA